MKADHPGVIKLHQTFQDARKLYFLLEFAQNGELHTYMNNEEVLHYKQAQFLAAEIVSMIEYLGNKKISHRDLKPSNLLFDEKMKLKLADFGSAKSFKDSAQELEKSETRQSGGFDKKNFQRKNTFVGTVEYMAPEVIQGLSTQNECDLWSLGVIIYKFFAMRSPFLGEFDEDTIRKIEEEDPIFPDEFPEMAQDLWQRLLVKDPKGRLGCGEHGTELDMFSLKAHPFFDGIDFDSLNETESPVPIPTVMKSSFKSKIIEECKRSAMTWTDVSSPRSIDKSDLSSNWDNFCFNNLRDWKNLELHQKIPMPKIRVLYQGTIKYRSRLLIKYNSAAWIFTDEPAFYLYSQNKGDLKARYNIQNYHFVKKNKNKFLIRHSKAEKLEEESDSKSNISEEGNSHKPSKFKICARKATDETTDSPGDLLFLLEKYCLRGEK